MNALDWISIAIIALLGIRCLVRGAVKEVLSVAAIALGLLAGLFLYKPAGKLLADLLAPKALPIPEILGFAAVFIIIFLVVKLLEKLLHEGLEAAKLSAVDRGLGLALGLAEGLLTVSILLVAMSLLAPALKNLADIQKVLDGSFFARTILPIVGPEVAKATQGIKVEPPKLDLNLQAPKLDLKLPAPIKK